MTKILNFQYASIHGFYWVIYACVASFASVFLLARGYSNSEIGVMMALANLLAVLIQPFTADLADRSKRISLAGICEIMTIIILICTTLMFLIKGKPISLFIIYVLALGVHTALQPLFNSLNFKLQESGVTLNFGMCRSMGSLVYSMVVLCLGFLVEKTSPDILPVTGLMATCLLLISVFITMRSYTRIKEKNGVTITETVEEDIDLIEFVKRNKLFFLLNVGMFLVYFENQVLNNFMYQIITEVGGNSKHLSITFSIMAFLEIPTMFFFEHINRKFSLTFLIKLACIGFTIKIFLVYIAGSVGLIVFAQFFQLISFAMMLPAMVKFIDKTMSKGEAVKGQSLYTMVITLSTIVASFLGGFIIDFSGPKMLTLISTILCAAGSVIVFMVIGRLKRPGN